ncbi:IS66 family insertion sequence element accessory protein TnpA [Anoxybacteroides amylolyticum]|uniref:IS66 family insertion sequence element accessory protein TnpA n=2 Tax=Anoxybacteroides amylolyticum TaxID=294699 RepID=UPI001EE6CD8A|nr:IS66 family insertion sequence element accessory protein TnpB [Anoxybacillus amylolyticus]
MADYRASGLTQAKWCERNRLKVHQLKYWLKRLEGSNATPNPSTKWASVVMADPSIHEEDSIQVKIGECSIEVKQGFNPSLFADVVKVLKTLC